MAAFNKANWSRLAIGGSIGTGSKSTKSLYGYWSNETLATIEASGYFDDLIDDVAVGDRVMAIVDLDGTPTMRDYYVSSVTTHVVLSRATDKVVGQQNAIASLTGAGGGTANGSLVDEGTLATSGGNTYSDAAVNTVIGKVKDNIAELAAKQEAILVALRAGGFLAT